LKIKVLPLRKCVRIWSSERMNEKMCFAGMKLKEYQNAMAEAMGSALRSMSWSFPEDFRKARQTCRGLEASMSQDKTACL